MEVEYEEATIGEVTVELEQNLVGGAVGRLQGCVPTKDAQLWGLRVWPVPAGKRQKSEGVRGGGGILWEGRKEMVWKEEGGGSGGREEGDGEGGRRETVGGRKKAWGGRRETGKGERKWCEREEGEYLEEGGSCGGAKGGGAGGREEGDDKGGRRETMLQGVGR